MLLHLILNAVALYITAALLPGIRIKGTWPLLVAVVVIALLNIFIRPILFFLTFPLTLVTFGLFIFVLNGIILLIAANIVKGFDIDSLGSGILGWIIFSIISLTLNNIFIEPMTYHQLLYAPRWSW